MNKNNIVSVAVGIINNHRPAKYTDYLIPELFERNVSGCKLSELMDAIIIAEYQTGKSIKRHPKEIIRSINKSINFN